MKLIYIKSSFGFTFEQRNCSTQNKNCFEKFIEELDFEEPSTQAKHLGVWILHED